MTSYTAGQTQLVNAITTGTQTLPQVAALEDGGWVVTWTSDSDDAGDIRQQRYSAEGTPIGSEAPVNTATQSSQHDSWVAGLADGGWVVSWLSLASGKSIPVQQRYDAAGVPVGEETAVSASGGTRSEVAGLEGGGWVEVWSSGVGGTNLIYQQAYEADGDAIGVNSVVSSANSSSLWPSVTGLADGGWVVTWMIDTNSHDIHQQRYDRAGALVGGEITVNTQTANDQLYPSIAALDDGGWVVAWWSSIAGKQVIEMQRYGAGGEAIGGETTVGAEGTDNRHLGEVTGLSNGGWVVTWTETGGTPGYYLQAYDSSGNAVGGEAQVTTDMPKSDTISASIAGLKDGSFVVTWTASDGAHPHDVQQRLFTAHDAPIAVDFSRSIAEDTAYAFAVVDFGFNDANADTFASLTIRTPPAGGVLTLDGAAVTQGQIIASTDLDQLVWTPATNANGDSLASLIFTVTDSDGQESAARTAEFDVTPVNDAPIAANDAGTFVEGKRLLIDVTTNDSDIDGDALSITAASVASGDGTVMIDDNGELRVKYSGRDLAPGTSADIVIDYTLSDGTVDASAQLSVTVTADPFRGTAAPDVITGTKGPETVRTFEGKDKIHGLGGNDRLFSGDSGDLVYSGNGRDLINAWTGNDTIDGGNGDDDLIGWMGDDTMTGGKGADSFVFRQHLSHHVSNHLGRDIVTDFETKGPHHDFLEIDKALGIRHFRDLLAHAEHHKGDTVITFDKNDSITLLDVGPSELNADDFRFV